MGAPAARAGRAAGLGQRHLPTRRAPLGPVAQRGRLRGAGREGAPVAPFSRIVQLAEDVAATASASSSSCRSRRRRRFRCASRRGAAMATAVRQPAPELPCRAGTRRHPRQSVAKRSGPPVQRAGVAALGEGGTVSPWTRIQTPEERGSNSFSELFPAMSCGRAARSWMASRRACARPVACGRVLLDDDCCARAVVRAARFGGYARDGDRYA